MTWFYAINGETKGPISEAQLRQLAERGDLPSSALVWREGMPEWVPFAASGLGTAPGFVMTLCHECGATVNPADAVQLEGMVICLHCKPLVLQKLQEGAKIGGTGDGPWQEGKHVVAKDGSMLTDRCFKCNQAADKHLKKKFYWHHPLYYILIAPGLLIYAIVAICVRRQATVHIGLCAKHNKARIFRRLIAIGLVFGGLGMLIFGGILGDGPYKQFSPWVAFTGLGVFLSSLVYALVTQLAVRKKITKDGYIWLKNSSEEFRNSLPKMRN